MKFELFNTIIRDLHLEFRACICTQSQILAEYSVWLHCCLIGTRNHSNSICFDIEHKQCAYVGAQLAQIRDAV